MFLTYGAARLECRVPGRARLLLPDTRAPERSEREVVRKALCQPVGSAPLLEVARGRRSAIILIACRTRRTGSAVFVPEIVETLNAAGIPDEAILVQVASGTHDNYRPADASLLAGSDCAARLRFAGHDCRHDLVEVGTTSRGNRVQLSRSYLEADLRVATGRVTYHYFAGFSGGRKAVLPGVSGFDTILFNHRLASRSGEAVALNPQARNGRLAENPVHLDMLEGARLAPPHFTLNTVLNADGAILDAFGGEMEASHEMAVSRVREADAPRVDGCADWLLLSCGGAHCDVDAVQAIKSLINNFEAVRPGGAIVLAAECPEGLPEWLRRGCAIQDAGELERRIARGEIRQPHNALWIRRVRERAHVVVVTKLAREEVADLGFHKAESLPAALTMAEELAGSPRDSFAVPFGNTTCLRVGAAPEPAGAPG